MKRDTSPYVIRTKPQLAALASPARQEIVDVLSQMGSVPVAELAATLGRPADALYYHLRVLLKAGLVIRRDEAGTGTRREACFETVSTDMRLDYAAGKQSHGRAVAAIAGSMLRLGIRDFRRAILSGEAKTAGPGRELWALRTTGWLTEGDVERVNRLIARLAGTVGKPRGKGCLFGVTVLFTPLGRRGGRKSK